MTPFNSSVSNPGPPGIPDLPQPAAARTAAASTSLNLDNIQGDILYEFIIYMTLYFIH